MYYADLTPCSYGSGRESPLIPEKWQVPLLAVGWLDRGHGHPQGEAPPELRPALLEMIESARSLFSHLGYRGLHTCSFCLADGVTERIATSRVNLLIPGDGVVWAATGGILHYLDAHAYLPPQPFIEAAVACPEYGSPAWFAALTETNAGVQPPVRLTSDWLAELRARPAARKES
ncbi:MAG: hypothetical protein H6739_11835 [Alphaproteobacteria bacterium]|nr:hypothetical protein [Alphaproteobacteria bacterium]